MEVLLPYEITLLSNKHRLVFVRMPVLLPYEITLLSNRVVSFADMSEFYYLIKLHYSQTETPAAFNTSRFYYLMKLHYSQTSTYQYGLCLAVLLPYEITLLSNLK